MIKIKFFLVLLLSLSISIACTDQTSDSEKQKAQAVKDSIVNAEEEAARQAELAQQALADSIKALQDSLNLSETP